MQQTAFRYKIFRSLHRTEFKARRSETMVIMTNQIQKNQCNKRILNSLAGVFQCFINNILPAEFIENKGVETQIR